MTPTPIRDLVWLWCQPAGCYHETWPNLPGQSRCSPAEAARLLNIDNIIMVRFGNQPAPPFMRETENLSFASNLVWSIVGDKSTDTTDDGASDVEAVVELSRRYPMITGGLMDDFFHPRDKSNCFSRHSVRHVRHFRDRLKNGGPRPLDLWCVLYNHNLNLPVENHLEHVDVVTFWAWNARDLEDLESNLERVRSVCGPDKRLVLGCYLWNFGDDAPIDESRMDYQLNVAADGVRQGELDGVVLLGSPVVDLPISSVQYVKNWLNSLPQVR